MMFRPNIRPRRQNSGRPAHKSAPSFLQWLRGRECILTYTRECRGKVRACHWDEAGDKGMGTKVSDRFSLPMCDGHHGEQTDILGWPKFQIKYRFNPREVCAFYWAKWPGRAKWEADNERNNEAV